MWSFSARSGLHGYQWRPKIKPAPGDCAESSASEIDLITGCARSGAHRTIAPDPAPALMCHVDEVGMM
jgi:hypothetical protein